MKKQIMILSGFIGLGACGGGVGALSDISGANMGIDASEALVHAPFATFLIPGLFLLLVIGVGNLLVSYSAWKQLPSYPYWEIIMGLIMSVWLFIQCIMLFAINPLHIIFFLLGLCQILFGYFTIRRVPNRYSFPFQAIQH